MDLEFPRVTELRVEVLKNCDTRLPRFADVLWFVASGVRSGVRARRPVQSVYEERNPNYTKLWAF